MKNMIKTAVMLSLLIVAGVLISSCGDTEQLARNQGDVAITTTDTSAAAMAGVLVQVRETAGSGAFINVGTTPASGKLTFTGTADKNYYFTFSKTGFTTQTDIQRTPQLTSTVTLDVTLVAL